MWCNQVEWVGSPVHHILSFLPHCIRHFSNILKRKSNKNWLVGSRDTSNWRICKIETRDFSPFVWLCLKWIIFVSSNSFRLITPHISLISSFDDRPFWLFPIISYSGGVPLVHVSAVGSSLITMLKCLYYNISL